MLSLSGAVRHGGHILIGEKCASQQIIQGDMFGMVLGAMKADARAEEDE